MVTILTALSSYAYVYPFNFEYTYKGTTINYEASSDSTCSVKGADNYHCNRIPGSRLLKYLNNF